MLIKIFAKVVEETSKLKHGQIRTKNCAKIFKGKLQPIKILVPIFTRIIQEYH